MLSPGLAAVWHSKHHIKISKVKYEKIDKNISKAALDKFCLHLWYLSNEIAVLGLFDDEVDDQTKMRMVSNLECDKDIIGKRYIPSKKEILNSLYGKVLL